MDIVRRSRYLDRLITFQDTDLIKIVTGIRRCGKSTLLDMMRNHLAQQGVPAERLLTFKMESLEYAGITDYLTFYRMVRERIDGIDHPTCSLTSSRMSGWEKAVNSLEWICRAISMSRLQCLLLSSELATLISGRYVEVKMQLSRLANILIFARLMRSPLKGMVRGSNSFPRRAIALIQIPCFRST
ncbi:MAG: AAA family ATPase [Collinsella sp.]